LVVAVEEAAEVVLVEEDEEEAVPTFLTQTPFERV